ncbi:cytochrome C [Parasphingopyxis algicola]|uniref:cytochrome c3 family protein n=1 Tax=Parasphingopyxis algicola TaxID=2026624 RepID=UPI0015A4953D|nr:cytochrome c3 family protein [Parasphingopyxis algicola]QLC23974.1 cytochrome C [Parasphingopyxis algicola]
MSFIVKYRSHTSGGREIVRARTMDKDILKIGRGAESDIVLSDLGVTLHHATIRRAGKTQITLETEKNLPVTVNGRSTTRADINAVRGGTIRIGPHRLIVAMGDGEDEEGRIAITIDREEVADNIKAHRLFSLAGTVPGKRISAWTFAALVLVSCLALPIWSYYSNKGVEQRADGFHADTLWVSGSMSDAHANLANDCQACHVDAFVSVRDSACLDCHTDIPDHAEADQMAMSEPEFGLGRAFLRTVSMAFNRPQRSCASCHIEHEGAGEMAAAPQQFCADCHTGLDTRLTDTDILNAHDFGRDHPEFRPRIMTRPADETGMARYRRVSLDDGPEENTGLKFPHELHLSETNGVARMAQRLSDEYGFGAALDCADCHVPTADRTRFEPISMEANCQMCHSLAFDRIGGTIRTLRHGEPEMVIADIRAFYRGTAPRRPIDLSGMERRRPGDNSRAQTVGRYQFAARTRYARADDAIRAVFSRDGACFDCHEVERPAARASLAFDITPVRQISRYMHAGWFDHAAHETEECGTCHEASTSEEASDVMLPGIETCRECHAGGTASGDEIVSTCAMCHSYHADEAAPYLVRARNNRGQRPRSVRDYGSLAINPRQDR